MFSCADGSVRRRQLRQNISNEPIATSVMVCAAMSSDAMVNGYVRMVNRWFHAVWHRQNTKKPSEKISANFNLTDQVFIGSVSELDIGKTLCIV